MSLGHAILAAAACVAVAGLVALLFGWRGRRVGDHPFCRRCGFDLFGLPADRTVCPECGADVSPRRATVIGMRRRRPVVIVTGLLLLVTGLVPLGVGGWGAWRGIDWQRHKPVAWLLREAQGSDPAVRSGALRELLRRQGTGLLFKDHVSAIVDAGLNVQADATRPWDTAWGDLIETARGAGMTSDAQWARYAAQAASTGWLSARVPAKWRAGQGITTTFGIGPARTGTRGLFAVIRPFKTVVDGKEFNETPGGLIMMPLGPMAGGAGGLGQSGSDWDLATLPLGKHNGYVVVKVRVTDPTVTAAFQSPAVFGGRSGRPVPLPLPPQRSSARLGGPRSAQDIQEWRNLLPEQRQDRRMARRQAALDAQRAAEREGEDFAAKVRREIQAHQAATEAIASGTDGKPTYADVEVKLPIQFELVGAGEPTATVVKDETLRAGIERSLSVEDLHWLNTLVSLTIKCATPPPVPLCFKVVLRQGTKEWEVGHANFEPRPWYPSSEWVVGHLKDDESPPTSRMIDVVLRPSTEPDEFGRIPDVDAFWGHEVVIKDVVEDGPTDNLPLMQPRPRAPFRKAQQGPDQR